MNERRNETSQEIQEEEYGFPYHYLPTATDGFQLTRVWRWGIQYMATIKYLIEQVNKLDFDKFLDVGCGDGRLVKEVSDNFYHKNVNGIDTSDRAILLAKALNPGLQFQVGDVCDLDKRECYDVASCIEVIEHIPPDQLGRFIEGLASVIKQGGYLFLTTPTTNKKVSRKHYQHFDYGQIEELLSPYFKLVKVRYIHKPNRVFGVLMKLLSNKWFSLNHPKLSDSIFQYYYKNVFLNESENGHRFFVVANKE